MGSVTEHRPTAWIPDEEWCLVSSPRWCRMPKCPSTAVAELRRRHVTHGFQWWAYCTGHLYGRKIENGVVMHEVFVNAPIYKRWQAKREMPRA